MELFLVISQGIGIAIACGISPFAAALVAGCFALADLGVDFEGSGYGFLESVPFLIAMAVLAALLVALSGARSGARLDALSGRQALLGLAAAAIVLGAFEFAGSLGDEGYEAAAGLPAGAVAAALGALSAGALLGGARERLAGRGEAGSASYLSVFAAATAALLVAIAIALPPLSYAALVLCALLLVQRRRRTAQKYEGLRVLR
jgi:hypothetical protein